MNRILAASLGLVGASAVLLGLAICLVDTPPRLLGPYVERRLSGHHRLVVDVGRRLARTLVALDRGDVRPAAPLALPLPAVTDMASAPRAADSRSRVVWVASSEQARRAIAHARPGDAITFAPGTYRFDGPTLEVRQPGTKDAGISVRPERAGSVVLVFDISEGFLVSAPWWSFENLTIRGACRDHSDCEHAFHVVAGAAHFVARNNTIVDFNSHFKINGSDGRMPDHGLIEGNRLSNTSARDTDQPVVLIDLVAASHWVVRGNLISDFAKRRPGAVSFGAYAKGGGSDNRFERNVVVCESTLRGASGQHVGLSLGGGGTAASYCRDGRCITEQERGVVDSNLIAACSDDGIHLNRAAASRIVHNTLIDTGGISVRFAQSNAEVEGNLVDGPIRSRDDGALHASDNLQTSLARLYLGSHPLRELYRDAGTLDLAWRGAAPRRAAGDPVSADLCGVPRPARPAYGAFENIAACPGQAHP